MCDALNNIEIDHQAGTRTLEQQSSGIQHSQLKILYVAVYIASRSVIQTFTVAGYNHKTAHATLRIASILAGFFYTGRGV